MGIFRQGLTNQINLAMSTRALFYLMARVTKCSTPHSSKVVCMRTYWQATRTIGSVISSLPKQTHAHILHPHLHTLTTKQPPPTRTHAQPKLILMAILYVRTFQLRSRKFISFVLFFLMMTFVRLFRISYFCSFFSSLLSFFRSLFCWGQ